MNLIKDDSFKPPKFLTGKRKWYVLGGFTVLLVVYNIIWQKTGLGQSPRELAYAEGMRIPAQHEDSVVILSLYDKLHRIYDQINAMNFDSLEKFNNVNRSALNADFHTKLITFDLLDFVFDTLMRDSREGTTYQSDFGYDSFFDNVNATMGNGNFVNDFHMQKFHKGFASDVHYLVNEKYIMVLLSYDFTPPSSSTESETFESGYYYGGILVFDLSTTEFAGYDEFITSNSPEVMSGPMKKDRVDQTLMADLEKNAAMHVNDIGVAFFGKKVWPVNYE